MKAKKLIDKLNQGVFLLVVEGKRDVAALRNIGITANIVQANGTPEFIVNKITKEFSGLKPVLLFDFDQAGQEKIKQLEPLILASNVVADTHIRFEFKAIFNGLHFFEDVDKKLEEIEKEI
ncbi:MAG: hypothetical protein V1644_00980 [Candidatus Micrarchaeota archaeon]